MTNIKEPLFRPDPARPGEFLVSMPGLLLLAAGSAYEADDSEVTPEGRAVGQRTVASILSAARAGGFDSVTKKRSAMHPPPAPAPAHGRPRDEAWQARAPRDRSGPGDMEPLDF